MSGERILVIDDSPQIVQHLVELVLPTFGFEALSATDGRAGLEAIRTHKPDLIMLDLNLPVMTGLDVLQTMVSESIDIPVILMTGYGSEKSAVEAFRLGVRDYLIKPFSVDEIIEAINHALVEGRLRHDKEQLAHQLRRTQADMRRRMNEMSTVLGIGKAVAGLLSVDQLLERVLEAAIYLSNAEESAIWLLDQATNQLHTFASKGGKGEVPQQFDASESASMIGKVLRSGRPLREAVFTGRGIKIKTGYHARAILYVPLMLRGNSLGVLSVLNHVAPRAFSERDEYLLSALADYAAIALQNARTFQEADKALSMGLHDLRLLSQVTSAMTSAMDLKKVVQLAIQHIHDSWEIEASSIWLMDKQSGNLRVLANVGTPAKLLKSVTVPLGRGFVGHVAQTGKPIFTNSVENHPLHYSRIDHKTGFNTRSLLCVPMIFGGTTIGALQLLNKIHGEFDEQDLERAMTVATAVAIGVTSANLYRQSEGRRQQLNALLENSSDVIVLLNEAQRITLFNQPARDTLGLSDNAVGKPLLDILPDSALISFLREVITNGRTPATSAGDEVPNETRESRPVLEGRREATVTLADGVNWTAVLAPVGQSGHILTLKKALT
jgi:GAF domain-containing protein/CheY-like chemotaxis protein